MGVVGCRDFFLLFERIDAMAAGVGGVRVDHVALNRRIHRRWEFMRRGSNNKYYVVELVVGELLAIFF